jgi:hypothetical protein
VKPFRALALIAIVMAASPAWAEDCLSAEALEQRLLETPVEPFTVKIEPAKPDQAWRIGSSGGGFMMAAPPLGQIIALRHATATTSCGLNISWHAHWGGGAYVTSASQFKVAQADSRPEPSASLKYRATTFRVTPDKASQTAWLSMTYGGRTSDYLLNFPASALSASPIMHTDAVWLELIGVRADGTVVYAEFNGMEPR